MRPTHFVSVALIIACFSAPSFAGSAEDATYDKHSQAVADSNGKCVRTKWQQDLDPCAPPAPPAQKPVPVAKPAPAPAPVIPTVSLEQRTIYFDFDSAVITAESEAKLNQLADIVNSSKAIADVRVHGFTDQFGTDDYNLTLAANRAGAVKMYLDGKSRLNATLAEVRGLGKSSPEAECSALKARDAKISCMAKERRVEIEFKAEK
jgi:outer membrane protein OmpA-like peptidoglycan-associated protein